MMSGTGGVAYRLQSPRPVVPPRASGVAPTSCAACALVGEAASSPCLRGVCRVAQPALWRHGRKDEVSIGRTRDRTFPSSCRSEGHALSAC